MNEKIIVIVGILLILLIIYALIKISKNFRKTAYDLFLYAEHNFIKGRKMDYCVEQIYDLLPIVCKILPKSAYKKMLQDLFDDIKDLLDDGKINKSKGGK